MEVILIFSSSRSQVAMRFKVPLLLGVLFLATLGGCGDSDQSDGCGTESNPTVLTVADRIPAIDASVANGNILHSFTVKEAPITFSSITLGLLAPKHTAGDATPSSLTWTAASSGKDLVWSTTVESWSTTPGHVEMVPAKGWKSDSGCYYVLPSPLFSYDVR
jgi:hypothetical protein